MFTLSDLSRSLRAYVGNDASETKSAAVKRAAAAAITDLSQYENWLYYQTIGRIVTVAEVSDGTIAYDHTGGLYERMVTLADSTWPSWAASGTVVIDNICYDVAVRRSDTIITLGTTANPGADVDAGTDYRLYRVRYAMPSDFVSTDQPIVNDDGLPLMEFAPRDWVMSRARNDGDGKPNQYCLIGDGAGGTDIIVWPPPDAAYSLEFLYRRKPTQPTVDEESTGSLSITSSSATATGTGTAFDSRYEGCVLRVSRTASVPTGPDGVNPYAFETTVSAVASATSITLEDAATLSLTKVGYSLSSPIDAEDGPMRNLLVQLARKQLRIECRINLTNEELVAYNEAVRIARTSNSGKTQERKVAGRLSTPYQTGPRAFPRRTN